MKRNLIAMILVLCSVASTCATAEGLLPSLTDVYGIPMPSLGDVLHRYPDEVTKTPDGDSEQHWSNIFDSDFEAFGIYLGQVGAELRDYSVMNGVFTATVARNDRVFTFTYDSAGHSAVMTYPAGVYDERIYEADSKYHYAMELFDQGRYLEALAAYSSIRDKNEYHAGDDPYEMLYSKAATLRDKGKYEDAITIYQALGSYSDSETQILDTWYMKGEALQKKEKWKKAAEAFEMAGDYKDAAEQIKETYYLQAKTLLEGGKYEDAYAVFVSLTGYKDVDELLNSEELAPAAHEAKLKALRTVGSIVNFGHYEQDNDISNGQESIDWVVLDVQGDKSLLISRYGVDAVLYNQKKANVTWETCSLRRWLNNDFLRAAFDDQEQKAILKTMVDNSAAQGKDTWKTNGGNRTQDKIFLLSYAEAQKYFDTDETRRCAPTAYAKANGASTSNGYKVDGHPTGWWWLRSPGSSSSSAAFVGYNGAFGYRDVDYTYYVVRPALWIDLGSDYFQ